MNDKEQGEGEKMSAQKRRNILVGFGGVAIVLALAVVFISPNFPYRSEDASGAIGAVRKHRAPQIQQSDVVLGDEAFKQEQAVVYGDLLADAEALQNISADLASEAQTVDARVELAARQLSARSSALNVRYSVAAKNTLEAMKSLGAEAQLGKANFQDLSARAETQFGIADMEQFAARLANAEQQLAARKDLANVEQQLAAFSLDAKSAQTLAAAPNADALRSAVDADHLAAKIRSHAEYLAAIAKQAKTLDAANRALQAKTVDARSLGRMSSDLLREADQLEARAVANMEQALAAQTASADALGRMSQNVLAAKNSLNARENIDARAVAAARTELAAFDAELAARKNAVESRASVAAQAQLAAVNRHLEARKAVGTRASLASAMDSAAFAARAKSLAARAENLAARVAVNARANHN